MSKKHGVVALKLRPAFRRHPLLPGERFSDENERRPDATNSRTDLRSEVGDELAVDEVSKLPPPFHTSDPDPVAVVIRDGSADCGGATINAPFFTNFSDKMPSSSGQRFSWS